MSNIYVSTTLVSTQIIKHWRWIAVAALLVLALASAGSAHACSIGGSSCGS